MQAGEEKLVFHEPFAGRLDRGWSWLRENRDRWRLRDGGLEIAVEPGLAGTVRNALLRPAPDRERGTHAVEVTVVNHAAPTQQYEQAGITWYQDGEPVFKEVKELVDGRVLIIPGARPAPAKSVRLRLVVTRETWEAQYRPEGASEFLTSARGELAPARQEQVSIQCYNGPPDAEHWIRFEDFRILRL